MYEPPANLNGDGAVFFDYFVSDGIANSSIYRAHITLYPVHDAPLPVSVNVTTLEDQDLVVPFQVVNIEGDQVNLSASISIWTLHTYVLLNCRCCLRWHVVAPRCCFLRCAAVC